MKSIVASEQNIIDCDYFVFGCNGGWPSTAFKYAEKHGISDGRKYNYQNSLQMCQKKQFPSIYNVTKSCENYLQGDEEAMKVLVAKRPVAIGFAVTVDFMYYKTGIYVDTTCSKDIDHAMVSE